MADIDLQLAWHRKHRTDPEIPATGLVKVKETKLKALIGAIERYDVELESGRQVPREVVQEEDEENEMGWE
jgi:hypothetical protein